jgi:hypothetical protein
MWAMGSFLGADPGTPNDPMQKRQIFAAGRIISAQWARPGRALSRASQGK